MISMRRLLVAADGSASADQAALFAGRLASRFGAKVGYRGGMAWNGA